MPATFALEESQIEEIKSWLPLLQEDTEWQPQVKKIADLMQDPATHAKEIINAMLKLFEWDNAGRVYIKKVSALLAAIAVYSFDPQELLDEVLQMIGQDDEPIEDQIAAAFKGHFLPAAHYAATLGLRLMEDSSSSSEDSSGNGQHANGKHAPTGKGQKAANGQQPKHKPEPRGKHGKRKHVSFPTDCTPFCTHCGSPAQPPSQFCGQCGHTLSTKTGPSPPAKVPHPPNTPVLDANTLDQHNTITSLLGAQTQILQKLLHSHPPHTTHDSDDSDSDTPCQLDFTNEKPLNNATLRQLTRAYAHPTQSFARKAIKILIDAITMLKAGHITSTEQNTLIIHLSSATRDLLQYTHNPNTSPLRQEEQAALQGALKGRLTTAQIRQMDRSQRPSGGAGGGDGDREERPRRRRGRRGRDRGGHDGYRDRDRDRDRPARRGNRTSASRSRSRSSNRSGSHGEYERPKR